MVRNAVVPGLQNATKLAMEGRNGVGVRRQQQQQASDASLNHLLGFTLPPRQRPSAGPRRGGKRGPQYSKDRFIHAQYRFVLKPTGDYTAHFADADIYLHWPDILQVIVPISTSLPTAARAEPSDPVSPTSKPLCPICLSEPSAPRMTRCGHVFCYHCLLHYLEVGEESKAQGRKCPVCWDIVLRKDLKSVRWFDAAAEADAHGLGSIVVDAAAPKHMTFRLIQRPDITTLALPRSSTWPSEAVNPHQTPWHFTPDAAAFAKMLLASPDYMFAELQRDLKELESEATTLLRWASGEDDLGIVFIRAAQRKVHEQLDKVASLKTTAVMTARKLRIREIAAVEEQAGAAKDGTRVHEELAALTTTDEEEGAARGPFTAPFPVQSAPDVTDAASFNRGKSRRNVNPPAPSAAMYYFYQAASGQPIFLHPLDIRILKSHFGSYSAFPDSITLPIEGHEDSTMTEELRRKCRYLSHLPTACDVVFVETTLDSLVSAKALEPFGQALKQRRTKRKERAKREDKAKVKSERREKENALANLPLLPARHAPVPPLPSPLRTEHAAAVETSGSEAGSPPSTGVHLPPTNATDVGPRTVWGTRAVSGPAPNPLAVDSRSTHDLDDDDGYDHVWAEFEEDIVLNRSQRPWAKGRGQNGGGSPVAAGGGTAPSDGGRKKGRKRKVVLNLSGGAMRGA